MDFHFSELVGLDRIREFILANPWILQGRLPERVSLRIGELDLQGAMGAWGLDAPRTDFRAHQCYRLLDHRSCRNTI